MTTKYYSVNETLSFLGKIGLTIDIFSSQVREKAIHPIIYINSLQAHACEADTDEEKNPIAIGHCFLSAYWDLNDEMVAIMDCIIRDGVVRTKPVVQMKNVIGTPEMHSWQYDYYVFSDVPPDQINPKPYSAMNKIAYYILRTPLNNQTVKLTLANIVITSVDFEKLKAYLLQHNNISVASDSSLGSELKSSSAYALLPAGQTQNNVKSKQTRHHALNELIKEMHSASTDKSAAAIWKKMKSLTENDDHKIIQEMDSWSSPNPTIKWVSHRNKECSKNRRTFENDIAKLNKSYI
jgi:hypothetical protein